jgi:hypothetical protein
MVVYSTTCCSAEQRDEIASSQFIVHSISPVPALAARCERNRRLARHGRCKVHGGKSTGPRTPEGLERSRRANWKHGYYSREAKAERSRVRAAILALRYLHMLGH